MCTDESVCVSWCVCVCVSHFCLTVRGWGRKWCEGERESGNSTCVRVSLCGEMGLHSVLKDTFHQNAVVVNLFRFVYHLSHQCSNKGGGGLQQSTQVYFSNLKLTN